MKGVIAVIAGIGVVLGVVFVVLPELDPKAKHSGEITEARILQFGPGYAVFQIQAHLEGFNGKDCPVGFTTRVVGSGAPVPGYDGFLTEAFHPESQDERALLTAQLPTPQVGGTYYVDFYLYDNDGMTILDTQSSHTYDVPG